VGPGACVHYVFPPLQKFVDFSALVALSLSYGPRTFQSRLGTNLRCCPARFPLPKLNESVAPYGSSLQLALFIAKWSVQRRQQGEVGKCWSHKHLQSLHHAAENCRFDLTCRKFALLEILFIKRFMISCIPLVISSGNHKL